MVGTGMGGGSFIARYLRTGKDMVVIEAGSERENVSVESESGGRDFGLPMTREISLGGTSNAWRGLCSPMDRIDFTARPWIPRSGWPISLEELDPYYKEAGELLGLPDSSRLGPGWSDHPSGNVENAIVFNRDLLTRKYFLQKRPPRNFRHDILKEFRRNGEWLLMNAVAVEIITDPSGRVVRKILVKSPRGDTLAVHARRFVICAGALETPRLLLNSRSVNERGIGNSHDLVGRFLMDHPMGSLSQLRLDRIRKAPLYHSVKLAPGHYMKAGFVLREEQQERNRLPNHCFHLWPSFRRGIDDRFEALRRSLITARNRRLNAGDIRTLLSNPNTLYRILCYLLPLHARYLYADLFFVTEQIPDRNSTVSLSDVKDRFGYPVARIGWRLGSEDLDSISVFNEISLGALSSGSTSSSFRKRKEQMDESLTSAAHHMGTARMSAGECDGVVDRDLKVWGVENLYLCDASVFPTSGNANPALTISALAIRLADRLSEIRS